MPQIPTLLQICAEEIAINSHDRNTIERVREYINRIDLPRVSLSCIKDKLYETCDFAEYIESDMDNRTILRTLPKSKNADYKLIVGDEKIIYISTLSDLGHDMIKLDFPTGEYGLHPFHGGYVLKTKEYAVKIDDTYHIFNAYDSAKGLASVLWRARSTNADLTRIFNEYISEYITEDDWWGKYTDYEYRTVLECLESYNNIPIFFYLTQNIELNDLSNIALSYPNIINNCCNVEVCWYVDHIENGRIGIAIKQSELYKMMGDKVGVCLLTSSGHRAVGNFDNEDFNDEEDWVFYPNDPYECDYKNCSCDASYKPQVKKRKMSEPGCSRGRCVRTPVFSSDSS